MLVDLRSKEINGKQAQEVLDRAGITVNKNAIPFDTYPIFKPGGIRVGTPAVTTRGMREEEMLEIADLVAEALQNRNDNAALERVRGKVRNLTRRFPLPSWGKRHVSGESMRGACAPRTNDSCYLICENLRNLRIMTNRSAEQGANPLREGLSTRAVPQPCAIVI